MTNISIARWKGRIRAAFSKMMQVNGLRLTHDWITDDKWPAVLLALSERVRSQKHKDLCLALMAKSSVVFCQTEDPSGKAPVDDSQEISNGMREVEYWFGKAPNGSSAAGDGFGKGQLNWCDKIIADVDYIPEIEAEARKRAKRKKTVLLSIFSAVAAVIATCIVYNLPYFAEKRAYDKVVNDPTGYQIGVYISEYPQGAHIEEVMRLKDDWCFQKAVERLHDYEQGTIYGDDYQIGGIIDYINDFPQGAHIDEALRLKEDRRYEYAKDTWDKQGACAALNSIDTYLVEYPEGRYVDSVKFLYNQIWDSLITRYDQSEAAKKAPGRKYMHDMLVYMKEHNTRTVMVVGHPKFSLKEFSEYPKEVQTEMIQYYQESSALRYNIPGRIKLSFPRDLRTIKDKITVQKAEKWTDDIASTLGKNFDNLFGRGFIQVVVVADGSPTGDCPTVDVNYVIKNQESWGEPHIWRYTETQGINEVSGAFYMGVALDFTADFAIPGTRISYKVKASGDPGSTSFEGVETSQVYDKMCERCLKTFDQKINTSLGLKAN